MLRICIHIIEFFVTAYNPRSSNNEHVLYETIVYPTNTRVRNPRVRFAFHVNSDRWTRRAVAENRNSIFHKVDDESFVSTSSLGDAPCDFHPMCQFHERRVAAVDDTRIYASSSYARVRYRVTVIFHGYFAFSLVRFFPLFSSSSRLFISYAARHMATVCYDVHAYGRRRFYTFYNDVRPPIV